MKQKLYLVRFEIIMPVVTSNEDEAGDIAFEYLESEIYDKHRLETYTKELTALSELTKEMGKRKPVNGHPSGMSTRELLVEIIRQKELDEKYQLRLFE